MQWKAVRGETYLYGLWQTTDLNTYSGTLQLCAGTLALASAAQETAQEKHTRFRIPLWAVVALGSGLAGGLSRSISKNPFSPD